MTFNILRILFLILFLRFGVLQFHFIYTMYCHWLFVISLYFIYFLMFIKMTKHSSNVFFLIWPYAENRFNSRNG